MKKLRSQEEIMAKWLPGAKPLVSIRCTTFNQEKYIAECIEGFLIQETDFPFEVCIHEDASKDSTASIVREYEAKYPKIIKTIYETENQWSKQDGSFTRIVTSMLTSKYVAMCEGDDFWIDPFKLQKQVDFLESHSDYSMVFHDAVIKNEPGVANNDSIYPKLFNRDYNATELFEKWTVPTASIVCHRKIFDIKIKHSEKVLNGDIFLVERCAHYGKVRCINQKMSVYRRQPNGVTWDKKIQEDRQKKYPEHYKAIKENFPLIKKSVIDTQICIALHEAVKHVSIATALSYIIESFFLSPCGFFKSIQKKIIYELNKSRQHPLTKSTTLNKHSDS